ncbi:MAG TPA: 2-oxoacid:acceptor oxidoreductase subunit alpha [Dehalococcoidia bacterium]|nr:2-oxoacid:acceptor oxidoreductase subunit alpha [Dehalococcoidia bacterium]MDP7160371.1 2-oxoacid:acceptor oxidoreductase subunit alpha [Dehalococcoidia bacterium]MDP7213879.1 2-oxoacid:acceptor oxidoreductase subunit alpha [Dehalococcoidia bacterium]MDP7513476.1 2-oxoacid:acceptor oxidoreductase subunit alpha [Dehalococcoidia bacterium]HJM53268.1 2-oxoacid:acceptor oxidoreductase subunit alpha [Dehalococcoidia bacterium]
MGKTDLVVRFAGEAGVVTSAESLAATAAQAGYHVQTYATYPSQILGGPVHTQVHISTCPTLSDGDDVDVLVAFSEDGFNNHKDALVSDGVIIYNSGEFDPPGDSHSFGLPFDEIAKEVGNARASNMVVLGAIAPLSNFPLEALKDYVTKRFTRGRPGDEKIVEANSLALDRGAEAARTSGFHLTELDRPIRPDYEQIMISGNAAVAVGAVQGGLDFYAGYPISPATTILVWMEQNLVGEDRFTYQASSEIEAIGTIIGAGFNGRKAMTATAGPGIALMSEGLGFAWMAEIPCVVVDVQRGGPATGLPTKTEQSDLFACMYPAHGDVRMPVIAPGTVEECFYAGALAINWAERYQGPVIVMSEMQMAERSQNIPKPDVSKVAAVSREVYTGENGYQRYDTDELGPMPLPGGPGAYVANASEHDGMGDSTHLPIRHIRGMERRFGKLKLLNDGPYEIENPHAAITLMPWGGSKGTVREAYLQLRKEGVDLGWLYSMTLHPLPEAVSEELGRKELVIVPELNYQGQWSSLLRSDGYKATSITQYTGLPFKVRDLVARIKQSIEAHKGGKILV